MYVRVNNVQRIVHLHVMRLNESVLIHSQKKMLIKYSENIFLLEKFLF